VFDVHSKIFLFSIAEADVCVVTHGGVINIIYHIVKGLEWSNKVPLFSIGQNSIHILEYIYGQWEITLANSVADLS